MSFLRKIAQQLPAGLIRELGSLQYQWPWLQPLIQRVAESVRHGPSRIQYGVGEGLWFDPHGGNPGYALGTSGIEEQRTLAHLLRKGDVFYDLGTNKGFYAVVGAHIVGSEGKVYAFEPFPESVAAIRSNVDLNEFKNVEILEAAVSAQTSTDTLILDNDSLQHKLSSSLIHGEDTKQHIEVDVYCIDDLVAADQICPPDVVMIDVEEAEVDVLSGMRQTIQDHRPEILCEVHWIASEFRELIDNLFTPLNYQVTRLDGSPIPTEPVHYHALLTPA